MAEDLIGDALFAQPREACFWLHPPKITRAVRGRPTRSPLSFRPPRLQTALVLRSE